MLTLNSVSGLTIKNLTFDGQDRCMALIQVFGLRVYDSGANGTRGDSDDKIFAGQGIYIP